MFSLRRRTDDHLPDEALSAALDGKLRGREFTRAWEHIAACEACSGRLVELESLRTALSSLPRPVATRSFALTPAMAGQARRRPASSRALTFVPALALTVLVALFAIDLAGAGSNGASISHGSSSQTTSANYAADATTGQTEGAKAAAPIAPGLPPSGAAGGGTTSSAQSLPQQSARSSDSAALPPTTLQAPSTGAAPAPAPIAPGASGPATEPLPGQSNASSPATAPSPLAPSAGGSGIGQTPVATNGGLAASASPPLPATPLQPASTVRSHRDHEGLLRALEVLAGVVFVGSLVYVRRAGRGRG